MSNITNPKELEDWLGDKPIEWGQFIVLRSALRTIPALSNEFEKGKRLFSFESKESRILEAFRGVYLAHNFLSFSEGITPNKYSLILDRMSDTRDYLLKIGSQAPHAAKAAMTSVSTSLSAMVDYDPQRASIAVSQAATAASRIAALRHQEPASEAAAHSARLSIWRSVDWDASGLVGQPMTNWPVKSLWEGRTPEWASKGIQRLFSNLEGGGHPWWMWNEWYLAMTSGQPAVEISRNPQTDLALAVKSNEWWRRSAEKVNLDILHFYDPERVSVAQFILNFLAERRSPARNDEIADAFAKAKYPIVPKTMRGQLSRLASSGQIVRVQQGLYASSGNLKEDSETALPPPLPSQGHGPNLGIFKGKVALVRPPDIDDIGNDVTRLAKFRPLVGDALDELLSATPTPANPQANDPYERLRRHARTYRENLAGDLRTLDYELLFGLGTMLMNRLDADLSRSSESDYAPLSDRQRTALKDFKGHHGPFITGSKAGLAAIDDAERLDRNPTEEKEFKETVSGFAAALQNESSIIDTQAGAIIVDAANAIGEGRQAERSFLFGKGAIRNAIIVVSAGGVIATLASIAVASGGVVALISSALGLVVLEGTKRSKAFKVVSEPVQRLLDQLSDLDMEKLAALSDRNMEPYVRFMLKEEGRLRAIAGNRPELEWLHKQLDLIKKNNRPKQ
ncbi:type IV toxin-antitoxin system AbiEi family antitoxin domain-containing protein [Mesorhizobium sp. LSJC264A00]|uniref:type IV toxin-antitoxin system AbiEi family antitoxin domain-containing protein n=1 Tax=unclassified Mesorhizobium TaxID=325217 RepID=UPI0012EB19B5|nr:type IV toxin-antitoxin system AbiEi family antitoxin domain-containing protein [Mesorhizobium sp. LSJC264A00]